MKQIFLTSVAWKVLPKIVSLLSDASSNLKVSFIPTASDTYKDSPWVDDDRNKLVELGFQVEDLDIKNKTRDEIEKALADADIIFVAGGNTFYLLEQSQKSGFEEVVRDLVEKGIIYIGSSAGSVIAGPDIESVALLDEPEKSNPSSTKGFGLVDFVVLPHYGKEKYSPYHEKIMKEFGERYDLKPLKDDEAIYINGDQITRISK